MSWYKSTISAQRVQNFPTPKTRLQAGFFLPLLKNYVLSVFFGVLIKIIIEEIA